MTRKNLTITGVLAIVLIGAAAWLLDSEEAQAVTPYRLAGVEHGDIAETIGATGTVTPVQTVAIGTRVSGEVIELSADFNDKVKAGQLLARIDPTLQQQSVRSAEATLVRAQADLKRQQDEYDRNKVLFEKQVITESEFSQIEYSLAAAKASLTSSEINLEQARQNLEYTQIFAPIDGVVIERNAEVGQTVAASLSTPQLFLLARDLTQLEILASVSELDIGMIEPGQIVHFTVQAYQDEEFDGSVQQVRLQSATTENVVNYTVVIDVENLDGRLLPGMTADVEFVVRSANDVLMVSNAALRFTPPADMLEELEDSMVPGEAFSERSGEGAGTSAAVRMRRPGDQAGARTTFGPRGGAGGAGGRGGMAARQGAEDAPAFGVLWYLRDGQLAMAPVRTGISNGIQTVVSGPDLAEGMQVIAGMNIITGQPSEQTSNPFEQQRRGGFRGRF